MNVLLRPDHRPRALDYAKLSRCAYNRTGEIRQGQLISVNDDLTLSTPNSTDTIEELRILNRLQSYIEMLEFCDKSDILQAWNDDNGGNCWLVLETFGDGLVGNCRNQEMIRSEFNEMINEELHVMFFYGLKDKQLVLAFKGTTNEPMDQPNQFARDWFENIGGIIVDLATTSQRSRLRSLVTSRGTWSLGQARQLSFTGHSKGGFQAELALHHVLEMEPNGESDLNAVVFESPGVFRSLLNLQSNVLSHNIPVENYDIASFLSGPNLVNKLNAKLGALYHLTSVNDHGIDTIITALVRNEGQENGEEIRLVQNWPSYTVPSRFWTVLSLSLNWFHGQGAEHQMPPAHVLTHFEQSYRKLLPLCNVHPNVRAFLQAVQVAQKFPTMTAGFQGRPPVLGMDAQNVPANYQFLQHGKYLDVTNLALDFNQFRRLVSENLSVVPNVMMDNP